MMDYDYQIMREVGYFEYTYNKSPSAIFMSYGLYSILTSHYIGGFVFNNANSINFYGIPVKLYNSDKIEFYLAESVFEFKEEGGDLRV